MKYRYFLCFCIIVCLLEKYGENDASMSTIVAALLCFVFVSKYYFFSELLYT